MGASQESEAVVRIPVRPKLWVFWLGLALCALPIAVGVAGFYSASIPPTWESTWCFILFGLLFAACFGGMILGHHRTRHEIVIGPDGLTVSDAVFGGTHSAPWSAVRAARRILVETDIGSFNVVAITYDQDGALTDRRLSEAHLGPAGFARLLAGLRAHGVPLD